METLQIHSIITGQELIKTHICELTCIAWIQHYTKEKRMLHSKAFFRENPVVIEKGAYKYYVSKEMGGWGKQMLMYSMGEK